MVWNRYLYPLTTACTLPLQNLIEMSMCAIHLNLFSLTKQPQNNLHYMMTEHRIPANWRVCAHGIGQFTVSEPVTEADNYAVVEISNHLATFFVDSKLSRHFVGYSVLEQVP